MNRCQVNPGDNNAASTTCFYCKRGACFNCMVNTEWDESICVKCSRYLPLKKPFEDMIRAADGNLDYNIEKHKYLKHNSPNLLTYQSNDYSNVLDPIVNFLCLCGVSESKYFKLSNSGYINRVIYDDESLSKIDFIDEYNFPIYDRDPFKAKKNVFFLHKKSCNGELRFVNKFTWKDDIPTFRAKLELMQYWTCNTCKVEFVNMFKENRTANKYRF